MAPVPRPLIERWEVKVQKTETCWLWTGAKIGKGYGVVGRGGRGTGFVYAHRFAYEHFVGPLEPGQHVHHECENPSCVNPDHLRAMRVADHNRASSYAKLTREAVALIKESDWTNARLARALGVDPSVISRVRSGAAWS